MNRYYPSLKDIVYTSLSIIHNHPTVKTPIVKSPVPNLQGIYPTIPIDRYRTYAGIELLEPGLTLSIYPVYDSGVAAEFKPVTVGGKSKGFMYEALYRLEVHLAYQEVAINETKQVIYVENRNNQVSPNPDLLREQLNDQIPAQSTFAVEINIAEDILRDYLEVIRVILEQIDYYAPWNLRGTNITNMKFPTTSWSANTNQVYFHEASMLWEVSTYSTVNL